MKKVKWVKAIIMVFVVCCVLGMSKEVAFAKSVYESESNDTKEEAEEIEVNKQNAVNAANGKSSTLYHVSGSVSKQDEDWFKVYLSKGKQYVSVSGDSLDIEVWSEDGTLILKKSYLGIKSGFTAYSFEISRENYYYVRLSSSSYHSSYTISVGEPNYSAAWCRVTLDPVTITTKQKSIEFDLSNEDVLPEGAIVHTILMSGLNSQSVNAISVKNVSTGMKTSLRTYSWSQNKLESLNMLLKSRWILTFSRKENVTFTPTVTLYYVYPITSETVNTEIILSK